ncbi:hypothetical protein [Roseovarius aestuariivivens]|uniref:hypothetical protein n=1 Tax=Roseovarius aestuariivivens TaxID=1888910 RepID=UPI00108178EF|nr:hypothetical protein [Roseovarius aestuariivivens]
MIELIFMTCLVSDPSKCREQELIYYDISMMTCMMKAQPMLAHWATANPGWRIDSWRCGMVRSADSEA